MNDKPSTNLVRITYDFLGMKKQSGNLYIAQDDEQTFDYINKLSKSEYFNGIFNYEHSCRKRIRQLQKKSTAC